jgi:hypothetical protein
MSKQTFCLKTCRWLFIALTLTLPISSQADAGFSSLVFCEMANSCVVIDKNDPNFNEIFENAVGNTLQSTIKPTIINVMPRELPKGSTVNLTITAPNAHFNASSLGGVTMGGGVVVNSGIKVQTTEMVVNVTVQPDAPTGFYDISVETQLPDNPEKEVATGTGVFQVVAPSGNPEILGITPNRIPKPLNHYALSISGQDVHFSEDSVIDFGDAGIIVTGKTINSSTLMTVYIKVTDAAQEGLHNIRVRTGSEVARNTQVGILRVVGGECVLPPSLMAVEPWSGQQKNTLDVTVTGSCTHFFTGETAVKFAEGSGIQVLSTTVESENQATAKIKIAPEAPLGSHDVYVTTNAETVSFLKVFTVSAGEEVPPPPVPQLVHGNIQFSLSNQEVNENVGQIKFTVERLNGSDGEVTVEYEIVSSTATVVQDFTVLNGTLTWRDGETDIKELTVAIENDVEQEGDETFTIALSKVTGAASVDTTPMTITIIDDDSEEVDEPVEQNPTDSTNDTLVVVEQPPNDKSVSGLPPTPTPTPTPTPVNPGKIQFAPGNDTVSESAGSYIIRVQRKEGSDGKITVNVQPSDSIATGGMDFENNNGILTWEDADSSDKELIVKIINDSEFENDEIFIITLSDVTGGAIIEGARRMVTIIDDDIAPSLVISDDIIPPCRTSGEVRYSCSAKGLIITDVEVISRVYMKDGTLDGTLKNYGQVANFIIESGARIENYHWVSNLAIRQGANLTGGIFTGYITNEGTISDFDFRGASIIGGFLSGAIFNNSPVEGYFEDVFLMPKTYIIGGAVRGDIQGDSQYPALLSSLDVRINSHLSHVFIGAKVELKDKVAIGDGVVWMKEAKATNSVGESVDTNALMVGGGFTNDNDNDAEFEEQSNDAEFEEQSTVDDLINYREFQEQIIQKLSDKVNIHGRILVDSAHVGLPAEIIVYAIHTQSDSARRKPSFYMIGSEEEIYPWDEDVATLITFDELKSLEVVEDVEIFTGEFDVTGTLDIYFGYRLADGTVVESLAPIEVVIN